MTAPVTRHRIPAWVELPPQWERMPWTAQRAWLARTVAAGRPVDEEVKSRPVDEKGRPVWTREEQLAASRACLAWREGRGPELTEDQQAARRAYVRENQMRQRRQKGALPPGVVPDRKHSERVAEIRSMLAEGRTVAEIAADLGIEVASVRRTLSRAEAREARAAALAEGTSTE